MAEEEPEFQLTDDQVAEIRDAFTNYDKEKKGEIPTAILGTLFFFALFGEIVLRRQQ